MHTISRSVIVSRFGLVVLATLFTSFTSPRTALDGPAPAQLRDIPGLSRTAHHGQEQAIAVDACLHFATEGGLRVFSGSANLTLCTTGTGCFKKIYA